MAVFSDNERDRLDWQLMQNSAVTLYYRRHLFERDASWLAEHGYAVRTIDCSYEDLFVSQMGRALHFAECFGHEWNGNLDALNDGFSNVEFDGSTGVAFCLTRYDALAADAHAAHAVLDIIEWNSRYHLLCGNRLLALVQSDDPDIRFESVGARPPEWNRDEWFTASRRKQVPRAERHPERSPREEA